MATDSSILAWEIPWAEEPGGLEFMGSQRVEHSLVTKQQQPGEEGASLEVGVISANKEGSNSSISEKEMG